MATDVMSMAGLTSGLYSMDVHKSNAYNGGEVKFDLNPPRRKQMALTEATDITPSEQIRINPELSQNDSSSKEWEVDVKGLMSTKKWLQNYGLRRNRLDMHQILPQIGFKHSDDFDRTAKKPICSRYGSNLFQKFFRSDGKTYNISCTKDQLRQIEARLTQAIGLYKRRLDWLTSESRRVCGVIEEKSVAIVIDIKNLSPQQFEQYRSALERLVKEQIANVAKFNLIRASEDLSAYRPHCVPVSGESIDSALEWIAKLDRTAPISPTATCEALLKASSDRNCEAIYLFTEGSACDGARELLKEKLTGSSVPVHIMSYNCTKAETISFLKELARITGGRLHPYAVTMEMDSYEALPVDSDTNQANILLKKKTYGGVPPGAGMREDVLRLFEELEEARNNLAQIQGLLHEMPEKGGAPDKGVGDSDHGNNETYMSSREWLERHGLKSKRLGFYDILAGVAFKHQDGVVDLKQAPTDDEYQTDAITKQKLVNAKYCDKFPHVRWKDGQVVHVQVTPEIHRNYEQKMMLALETFQQRIDWLQQGSRELFGTVIEDQIYILIDTSASMAPHIQFLKDKLFVLMQEQLRHKQKFNLVTFNSRAHSWKDRLVEVTEKNLQGAWEWIKGLVCLGSTNTMAALRLALSDPCTQAIYLLTDGRPDQPPKSILAQVMLHPQVPVHTISFNCADREANEFLCQLAKDTGGRYHYYSENGLEVEGPEPWESEDIRMLKQEMSTGYRNLEKIAMLRDECAQLAWKKDDKPKRCSRDNLLPERGRETSQPPLEPTLLYRSELERPQSAPGFRLNPAPPGTSPRPLSAHDYLPIRSRAAPTLSARSPRSMMSKSFQSRPMTARTSRPLTAVSTAMMHPKKNVAGHTRTSLLRSLSSVGTYNRPPWLLPETREMFEQQWNRQLNVVAPASSGKKKKKGKKGKKNKENELTMSAKKWLSSHGLAAKKLSLIDALAPTFIPHKPTYIPIIDKQVRSKVFDDILPIGHVTGDKMNIVNPQAVKLDEYVKKVESAVAKYTDRLDRMVWQSLPKEAKAQYEGDGPISFLDNKQQLMEDLNKSASPVTERDIMFMENEIKQGEIYIKQANDLKEAAMNHGKGLERQDPDDGEDGDDAASTASRGSHKHYEGIGKALEAKIVKKEKTNHMTKHRMKTTLDVLRGQKVVGRSEVDGFYYPGVVIRCPDSRHVLVEYEDVGQQTVPTRFVIPTSGAISRPMIRVGDYVLSRVVNQDTGLECYVPGVVQVTPKRRADQAKFYTVRLYTTQQSHFLRSFLVKISEMRYQFLVRYIDEINISKKKAPSKLDRSRSNSRSSRSSYSSRSRSSSSPSSSRSRSRSQSRSRSRSRSTSSSSRSSRSSSQRSSSRHSSRESSRSAGLTKEQRQNKKLKKWQKKMEKLQRKNKKHQNKMYRLAHKLSKLKNKDSSRKKKDRGSQEKHKELLRLILENIETNRSARSVDSRTHDWVKEQKAKEVGFQSTGQRGAPHADHADRQDTPHFIEEMRRSLPELHDGEEILARWSDEGWYYRGTIKELLDDGAYLVEDSVDCLEKIWREDIIADNDDADVAIQSKDAVVALHPRYSFSYAPGIVTSVTSDLRITVRFYDDDEAELPREEVYRIPPEKMAFDVAYILQRELQWVGAPVVARNDRTGEFQLGIIHERIGNGRQYVIVSSDDARVTQETSHIFGSFTKSHSLHVGDRVLAIADPQTITYLPGWITARNGNKLEVKFCNGTSSSQIDPHQSCFWISPDYYDDAVNYYRSK